MNKKIRVLQFSSRSADNCGVGKYQENFVAAFDALPEQIETVFFDSTPYKTRLMNQDELDGVIRDLKKQLRNYDILHIQHEFGFFSRTEFAQIVAAAKALHKKVVVTVHLSPALAFKWKPRLGVGPRSVVHVLRQRRLHRIFVERHITPMLDADLLITHNAGATRSLLGYGADPKRVLQIAHPVLPVTHPSVVSTEIADNLHKADGDIIYATIGFMHRYKGVEDAVRALSYLPENYKLAIIGGMQPISDEKNIYNKIADLANDRGLKDRVYITGFIADDDRLNALIREADVTVYPYDNAYYGQVSSGSLNLAFANERPVIAYPTDSFKESNAEFGEIVLTGAAAYYELARELKRLDAPTQLAAIKKYAAKNSWPVIAGELVGALQAL